MTAKKTPAKVTKKTSDKVKWGDVESVPSPETTVKPKVAPELPADDGAIPFGSRSKIQETIRAYRKHILFSPIEKKGVATAPNGTDYNYYLTDDVFTHAYKFCDTNGAFLDSWIEVIDGDNVIILTLEHINSGQVKRVSANVGKPSSMSDFGGRITYAPKYLVALLFGISVQTDTDAFQNGTIRSDNQNKNEPNTTTEGKKGAKDVPTGKDVGSSDGTSSDTGSGDSSSSTGDSSSNASVVSGVEKSASYIAAHAFVEKAYSKSMLDLAATKLANSTKLTDGEKEELATIISTKLETVKE